MTDKSRTEEELGRLWQGLQDGTIQPINRREFVIGISPVAVEGNQTGIGKADVMRAFRPRRVVITVHVVRPWHWRLLRWFIPGIVAEWEERWKADMFLEQIHIGGKAQVVGAVPAFMFLPEAFGTNVTMDTAPVASQIQVTYRNKNKRRSTVFTTMIGELAE